MVAQSHEKRLFAESPDVMAAILFCRAQDSEVLSDFIENPRRCAPDRLNPVIVGGDAVDEIQRLGGIGAVEYLDVAGWLELFGLCPVSLFLLHLAVGVSAAF